jgi:hypothetical protein
MAMVESYVYAVLYLFGRHFSGCRAWCQYWVVSVMAWLNDVISIAVIHVVSPAMIYIE